MSQLAIPTVTSPGSVKLTDPVKTAVSPVSTTSAVTGIPIDGTGSTLGGVGGGPVRAATPLTQVPPPTGPPPIGGAVVAPPTNQAPPPTNTGSSTEPPTASISLAPPAADIQSVSLAPPTQPDAPPPAGSQPVTALEAPPTGGSQPITALSPGKTRRTLSEVTTQSIVQTTTGTGLEPTADPVGFYENLDKNETWKGFTVLFTAFS